MSLRSLFFTVKVSGESLWPELIPGRRYLASSLVRPRVGRYVVFKNPAHSQELFVKKVKEIKNDTYIVEGTVSWSASYRITKKDIYGTLLR